MQDINAWLLSDKNFEVGKTLYLKHGGNSFFKTLLASGPTPYNIKKLDAELKSLAPAAPAIPDKTAVLPSDQRSVEQYEVKSIPKDPDDFARYLDLKELLKSTYRQLERNMIELDLESKQSMLHLISNNILSLHQKIQDIYKLLDHFDEHETFPTSGKIDIVRTPAAQIQLLRVSNWKARKRLQAGCRDKEVTEKLILDNNAKIIELGGKVKI